MPKISELPAASSANGADEFAANQSGTTRKTTGTQIQTMVLDSYAGASSIVTVGTIGTGTWQGTAVAGQYGGTGVANTGKTITLGGNLTTSGAHDLTLTLSGATNVTLPTTGTLVAGGAATTSGLTMATARLLGRTTASSGAIEEISVSGLTLSGGTLTASAAAGAWVEISRTAASSSATVDFTGLSTTYDMYAVEIYNAKPAADDDTLLFRVSTNNGSSYDTGANYTNSGLTVKAANTVGTYRNASTSFIGLNFGADYGAGNATNENGLSGIVFIVRPAVAHWTQVFGQTMEAASDGAVNLNQVGGIYLSTTAVNAIRFYFSGGNVASGTFVLLGRKK